MNNNLKIGGIFCNLQKTLERAVMLSCHDGTSLVSSGMGVRFL
jgi:hypothetical protein